MKRWRPHYLRLVVVALCVAGLTVQANTYAGVVHVVRVPWQPPVCHHGTVPDLNPRSLTYGDSVCAR